MSNVVPPRAPDRPGPSSHTPQSGRLLRECRDLACERLSRSLTNMLDNAGGTLWELANASQEREAQTRYKQAKDKLLTKRKILEERFRSRYLSEFDERANRASGAKQSFSDYSTASLELNLVAEDDLDESLKANEMAARLRDYCEEDLVALDQRVGVLLGDANLEADRSPFSPQAICDAFKHACGDVEPDVKVRMVFVKLFDDHVLDGIRSIYKDVNALLVQNSILPKIRYGISRGQDSGGAPPVAGTATGVRANAGAARAGDAGPGAEQDIFSVLQSLVAMNARAMSQSGVGAAPQAGGAVGAGGSAESAIEIPGFPPISLPAQAAAVGLAQPMLQGAALLGSLTRIQHGDLSLAGGVLPLSALPAEAGTTNVLRELKGTSVVTGMAQMDVATLDIVAMLFDQIFEDPKVPDEMKWLIGRLQIPMLKVAILDKTFFCTREHPARQLLDTLGEIALGLPEEFDPSSELYARVQAIVQKLIDGFEDSLEIFDVLRQELQDIVAEDNQRVEEETRRMAARMEQKERLAIAKAVAQEEVKARARAGGMPKPVLKFLAQQWVKLLLITHAKRGKDGDAWKSAIEGMDQLVWSVSPKPSPEERRKLAALLPGLLKRLAAGMQIVGTSDATRTSFFADLLKLHTEAMGAAITRSPTPTVEATPASGGARVQPASAAEVVPPTVEAPHPSLAAPGPPPASSVTAASEAPDSSDAVASEAPDSSDAAASDPASLDFTTVTIKNPFGEGEVRVDEVELPNLPGAPTVAVRDGDEHSQLASGLVEGTWLEFRDDKQRHRVKLSYVSPFKTAYLFVNRQGETVGEYSLYELASELRAGRATVMDQVPLFDRAMSSLMSALRT